MSFEVVLAKKMLSALSTIVEFKRKALMVGNLFEGARIIVGTSPEDSRRSCAKRTMRLSNGEISASESEYHNWNRSETFVQPQDAVMMKAFQPPFAAKTRFPRCRGH